MPLLDFPPCVLILEVFESCSPKLSNVVIMRFLSFAYQSFFLRAVLSGGKNKEHRR